MLRTQYDSSRLRDRKSQSGESSIFYDGLHDFNSDSECGPDEYAAFLERLSVRGTNKSAEPESSSDTEELSSSSEDEVIDNTAAEMVLTDVARLSAATFKTVVVENNAAELASLARYLLSNLDVKEVDSDTSVDSKDAESIKLCLRRNALLTQFPHHSREICAAVYQAGLFKINGSAGSHYMMNSFFRAEKILPESELPPEIAELAAALREFTRKYDAEVVLSHRQTL